MPPPTAIRWTLLLLILTVFTSAANGEILLSGRHRLEFGVGYADPGATVATEAGLQTRSSVENVLGAFSYSYWTSERLATHVVFKGLVALSASEAGFSGTASRTVVVSSVMFGARYYVLSPTQSPLKPFVAIGLGPSFGVDSSEETGHGGLRQSTDTLGAFGGCLAGGVDVQLGHNFMGSLNVGYNLMTDFSRELAGEANYSGLELGASVSVLLG